MEALAHFGCRISSWPKLHWCLEVIVELHRCLEVISNTNARSNVPHRCMEMVLDRLLSQWDKNLEFANWSQEISLLYFAGYMQWSTIPINTLLRFPKYQAIVLTPLSRKSILHTYTGYNVFPLHSLSHCLSVSDLIYVRRFRCGLF